MTNKRIYGSLLGLSIAAALVGCGGGGSGNTTTPTGRAVDGPLAGASVIFKDCINPITQAPHTTQTNQEGFFDLPNNCRSSAIEVTGGLDLATRLPFSDTLKAPRSNSKQIVVSPLTTLIQAQVDKGQNVNAAAQQIARVLGLQGTNLLSADPMDHKELYTKTVVVQQLIEQIKHSIAPLGDAIPEEAFTAAAFAALSNALTADNNVSSLQDPAIIQATISQTLITIQDDLAPEYKDNIAEVSANLAALATPAIIANVQEVESALQSLPASTFAQGIEAIREETQIDIQAAKESIVTNKLVSSLAEILTLPAADASTVLAQLGTAALSNDKDDLTAPLGDLIELAPSIDLATLEDNLVNIDKFYTDYLKLSSFSILNQNYTAQQFSQSFEMPIQLSQLNGLELEVNTFGKWRNQELDVAAGLNIKTLNDKQVSITIDRINLKFDDSGELMEAFLPQGAQLNLVSNLNSVHAADITLGSKIDVLQNNKIGLNSAILSQISPQTASLANLNLRGETVILTAVLQRNDIYIANNNSNNQPVLSNKYPINPQSSGSGISAKFKIAP